MTEASHVVAAFSFSVFKMAETRPDSTKSNQIGHTLLKNERRMVFVTIKHSNEKNENNEKSDAAHLKPMRAGDGNLKISLPWP